jgi:hypothetical protein
MQKNMPDSSITNDQVCITALPITVVSICLQFEIFHKNGLKGMDIMFKGFRLSHCQARHFTSNFWPNA